MTWKQAATARNPRSTSPLPEVSVSPRAGADPAIRPGGSPSSGRLALALTFDFCDARAREAADAAEEATLVNLREQALRSEAAWRAMADQLRAVHEARETLRRERADRDDA